MEVFLTANIDTLKVDVYIYSICTQVPSQRQYVCTNKYGHRYSGSRDILEVYENGEKLFLCQGHRLAN